MERFDNKVVMITGGASGIGKEMAFMFQAEGATVIAADVSEQRRNDLSKEGIDARYVDVSNEDHWRQLADDVYQKYQRIDVLVNNAGISSEKTIQEIEAADWETMMNINGFGAFAGMKHVVPYMEKRQEGSVVNISSYTAQVGMGLNVYTASKGAVRAISRAASVQYGSSGIRVNAVFPGAIETPMTKGLQESQETLQRLVGATPLRRLGKPREVGQAVLFLASEEASFITGAELVIDGGFTAQ